MYMPKKRGSLKSSSSERKWGYKECVDIGSPKGRFPANLLVSDDILNDGCKHISHGGGQSSFGGIFGNAKPAAKTFPSSGSFSRYFSLDEWWREILKGFSPKLRKYLEENGEA